MAKCTRCHRGLKDPKSIERGMGPVCWAKLGKDLEYQKQIEESLHIPFTGNIVCTRIDGRPQVNIPQRIKYHSPDGFEWGYGGSGPADLALNILALFTDEDTAYRLYQDFKWEFIATLPTAGGEIKRDDILSWLSAHGAKVGS